MELQKINIKFFIDDTEGIALTDFINVFHSWIQASDGDYHDVADYSHVNGGPGILLIAHEENISIDNAKNRLGLLYNRKRPMRENNGDRLRTAFKLALEYCRKIEKEPYLPRKVKFRGDEALFVINDRMSAPNTKETFQKIKPALDALATNLFAGNNFTLYHRGTSQERFAVELKSKKNFKVSTLLRHLA